MKRMALVALFAVGLSLVGVAPAAAHRLTVTPPNQNGPVISGQDLAVGTPRLFADGADPGTAPDSAASQGTNVSCEAVHATGGVVDIDGGSCSQP